MNVLKKRKPDAALTFAGFDPCGGAGVLADCKAFEAHEIKGVAILTAITSQGASRISRVERVSEKSILESAKILSEEFNIPAIKTGMLHNAETVDAVIRALEFFSDASVIVDPVLRSSSGTRLLDEKGEKTMIESLFPKAAIITPNVPEATQLTALSIENVESAFRAAERLLEMGPGNVIIKGGHLQGAPVDVLVNADGRWSFEGNRIKGQPMHGTGCVFSSALTALIAKGYPVKKAVVNAKQFVEGEIAKSLM